MPNKTQKTTAAKEPKFTGIRKGYSAIFLGECLDKDGHEEDLSHFRFRVLTSDKRWTWTHGDMGIEEAPIAQDLRNGQTPCWSHPVCDRPLTVQIAAMKEYDRKRGAKTVFLGYVKDTE